MTAHRILWPMTADERAWMSQVRAAVDASVAAHMGLPAKPPYPEHCRHPERCAGATYCPRNPTCID